MQEFCYISESMIWMDYEMEEKGKGRSINVGYNKVIIDGMEWRWNYSTES